MNDILTERVQDIIASTFGLDPLQVPADASVRTLPAWSSLARLRLLSATEQEFGIGLTEKARRNLWGFSPGSEAGVA